MATSIISKITGGANWPLIIACFLFYFLGGYLFYAALFAAVGSVVNEDPQEAQSLMLPITMPIILSFVILSSTISHPNSSNGILGKHDPIYLTHRNDGAHSEWRSRNSSLVAIVFINGIINCRIYFYHLVCRQDLSHRNFIIR